ncbi:NAD(P)-binding domain-containing protein [Paracidovorax anthurii]|uniref:3-hydroxyisobutyrate dehydrogenase n=1 Tax=Paracidovorax anthurii TaxID=78229 RepID=A0A328YJL4_9BURK|nr:NAD(P)-binding domain-containing protein [Paracidovorax anthurii]RAR74368.1 3-hydroxyisobutyrate dehydrogenase [Paracidovorax anthurii]
MRIGLVGAGSIGGHIEARWLDAGHEVVVHDAYMKSPIEAMTTASLGELVEAAEAVCLYLPLPTTVLDVAWQIAQASARLIATDRRATSLVVDLSTTCALLTQEVHDLLAHAGIAFLSAPVSGDATAAAQGRLAVMTSGSLESYQQARPLLDAIGHHIFYLGADVKLGQTLKRINDTLEATTMPVDYKAPLRGAKARLGIVEEPSRPLVSRQALRMLDRVIAEEFAGVDNIAM